MNKMSFYRGDNIKALSERLGSLQIINKALRSKNKQTDTEMSIELVLVHKNNRQIGIPKSMVPDSG